MGDVGTEPASAVLPADGCRPETTGAGTLEVGRICRSSGTGDGARAGRESIVNHEDEMQEEFRSIREMAGKRELGNLTYAAEEARAQWRWSWFDNLLRDFRYALRVLAKQPSFTAVAVLSLGLGISANAAIFSLMDRVLWKQLPVREPERLVNFQNSAGTYFGWQEYQAKAKEMFEGVIGTTGSMERPISTGGDAEPGRVDLVTGNYFDVLGAAPLIGRTITLEDDNR